MSILSSYHPHNPGHDYYGEVDGVAQDNHNKVIREVCEWSGEARIKKQELN